MGDIAIYEYELPLIVDAVNAAHDRKVDVRVIYHKKAGDEQSDINEENLEHLRRNQVYGRVPSNLFHNKFIVLSKVDRSGNRKAVEVLCGSTNFTENGVYRQANVVHVSNDASLAATYLDHVEYLWAQNSFGETRNYLSEHNGFNPRANCLEASPHGKTRLTWRNFRE